MYAEAAALLAPGSFIAHSAAASLGVLAHLLGDIDFVPYDATAGSFGYGQVLAQHLAGAVTDPDLACRRLACTAEQTCDRRIAFVDAGFRAAFARCAWLAGETDDAAQLLRAAAARFPADMAMAVEPSP